MRAHKTTKKQTKKLESIRWLPLLSGLITGLAFVSTYFGWLVLVGLVPFIWYITHSKKLTHKQILIDCCSMSVIFGLITYGWMMQTVPSNWVEISSTVSLLSKTILWLVTAILSGMVFGIVIGIFIVKSSPRPTIMLSLLPVIWVLAELIRSYSMAILGFGPGSSLSPNWNFGSFGLAVTSTPLAYISRFGGLFILVVVALLVNIVIYFIIVKRYRFATYIVIGLLATSLLGWRLYLPNTNKTINIAVANLTGPDASLQEWDSLAKPTPDTDLLVLPEYSRFFTNPDFKNFIKTNTANKTTVVTTQDGPGKPKTNDIVYYSSSTGITGVQSKTFIIPYGEYMTYATVGLINGLGQQKALDTFNQHLRVKPGEQAEHVVKLNGLTIGGLACSGVLNLSEYRHLSHQGADVLTNSASLSLLNSSGLYRVNEIYQARLHAIANAKPFAQSAYSGKSFVLSSDGKVLVQSQNRTELLDANVQLQHKRTIYSLF